MALQEVIMENGVMHATTLAVKSDMVQTLVHAETLSQFTVVLIVVTLEKKVTGIVVSPKILIRYAILDILVFGMQSVLIKVVGMEHVIATIVEVDVRVLTKVIGAAVQAKNLKVFVM